MSTKKAGALRLVLGDQLTHSLTSLDSYEDGDVVIMGELYDEASYVKHHKKKIAFLFSAMRHFADELKSKDIKVDYHSFDPKSDLKSFTQLLKSAIDDHNPEKIIVTAPGEYRVLEEMKSWRDQFEIDVQILGDDRFISDSDEFNEWAQDRKSLRMEYFYRDMRRKTGLLMDDDNKPVGGEWNYDSENRESPPDDLSPPKPITFEPDEITKEVLELVEAHFDSHFGDLKPFTMAVTRKQALEVLDHFITDRLPDFGRYQDAMVQGQPFMYHSLISAYLNAGLLTAREVVGRAEAAYQDGDVPLNSAEGFIRQIIGWREFIRGVYWYYMPDYADMNALEADRALPSWFWTAETKMNCMRQCITETKENAYAHHIQRLMVLGNFALLAGLSPKEVNEWYLIVYADAYEWVEMPNVHGMILYADNGAFASKPYAASGTYINKMSDYCKSCSYSVTKKNGPKACPFNYLYWDFLNRHQDTLKKNPRTGMMYSTLKRMGDEKIQAIKDDSQRFFKNIEDS
jgi:deoxyribodipyrimidine photolyase-related protein